MKIAKVATNKKTQDQIEDPVKPRGIGLRQSEWARIEEIARELGIKPHAVALWSVRDFIKRYEQGKIRTKTRKSLI